MYRGKYRAKNNYTIIDLITHSKQQKADYDLLVKAPTHCFTPVQI